MEEQKTKGRFEKYCPRCKAKLDSRSEKCPKCGFEWVKKLPTLKNADITF